MRRLLRLLVAGSLAATGLIAIAAPPSLADKDVIDCPSNGNDPGAPIGDPVHNDPVIVEDVPVLGDVGVGEGDTCAELVRTLVFVGHADIDNGVNAAGVGGTVSISGGNQRCAFDEAGNAMNDGSGILNEYGQTTGLCDEGNNGGNFNFGGECILVNWDNPELSGITGVNGCAFNPTTGFYTRPNFHGTKGGGGGGLFGCIENGGGGQDAHAQCPTSWPGTPGDTGLNLEPSNQASCTASDGRGTSTFTADGGNDRWSSKYTWNDGLSNLRGKIWAGLPADEGTATNYIFDAKIQTQADPRSVNVTAEPLDTTAAGCLEKTAAILNPLADPGPSTGLNDVLVVGTASWRVEDVPEIFGA
ncbi:MAG: hypothetical protein HYU28_07300 [Actinobacteria bacterium]|nr:hypothetical protein [Actinomycetota bacterium]